MHMWKSNISNALQSKTCVADDDRKLISEDDDGDYISIQTIHICTHTYIRTYIYIIILC